MKITSQDSYHIDWRFDYVGKDKQSLPRFQTDMVDIQW